MTRRPGSACWPRVPIGTRPWIFWRGSTTLIARGRHSHDPNAAAAACHTHEWQSTPEDDHYVYAIALLTAEERAAIIVRGPALEAATEVCAGSRLDSSRSISFAFGTALPAPKLPFPGQRQHPVMRYARAALGPAAIRARVVSSIARRRRVSSNSRCSSLRKGKKLCKTAGVMASAIDHYGSLGDGPIMINRGGHY